MPDQKTQPSLSEDEAFDCDLAALMKTPGDEDVAVLSRSVLNQLAETSTGGNHPLAEVLSEPLPWAMGFAGLMGIGVALGYLLSSGVLGDSFFALLALGDFFGLLGGF
ncbi:hypothetical protein [Celeribacter sp. ULVN23_4]